MHKHTYVRAYIHTYVHYYLLTSTQFDGMPSALAGTGILCHVAPLLNVISVWLRHRPSTNANWLAIIVPSMLSIYDNTDTCIK